jgi:hypothetical protein
MTVKRFLPFLAALGLLAAFVAPVGAFDPSGTLAPTNTPIAGGTAQFTATFANLYWIPEVSVICSNALGQDYLNVVSEPETQYEVTPWSMSFDLAGTTIGDACVARLFYYTWAHCRDPKQGPFYCKDETGLFYLAEVAFRLT